MSHRPALLLSLLLTPALPGCWMAAATYTATEAAKGAGTTVAENVRPRLEAALPAGRAWGLQAKLDVTLFDADGDALALDLAWSSDGGATWKPAAFSNGANASTDGRLAGLASAPEGKQYAVLWDAADPVLGLGASGGSGVHRGLNLRLTASDARGPGQPIPLSGLTLGNEAPAIAIETIADAASGVIPLELSLTDSTSDPLDLDVAYSVGGAAPKPATIAVGRTRGLASEPGGKSQVLAWNAREDLGATNLTGVVVRVEAREALPAGADPALALSASAATPAFVYAGTDLAAAFIATPVAGARLRGGVAVGYHLFYPLTDVLAVQAAWSEDGGATWKPASERSGAGSDGSSGLAAGPLGTPHAFGWDSGKDLAGKQGVAVRFRIVPVHATTRDGLPAIGETFELDNNTEPVAGPDTPSKATGPVHIDYALADPESDPCAIEVHYSTDGGAAWKPAAEKPGAPSEGLTGLASSPTGAARVFVWDAPADLGAGAGAREDAVLVRVTASDHPDPLLGRGSPGLTRSFEVDLTTPPQLAISEVRRSASPANPAVLHEDLEVRYTLTDAESHKATVKVEYSTDNGANWKPATERPGTPSTGTRDLATSPTGMVQVFVWNTVADGVGTTGETPVRLRLTPSDSLTGAEQTKDLRVNNTPPSLTLTVPSRIYVDRVPLPYVLADAGNDKLALTAEYAVDGGGWKACTEAKGPPEYSSGTADLASRTVAGDPYPHTFVWMSFTDDGHLASSKVRVRLTATEPGTGRMASDTLPEGVILLQNGYVNTVAGIADVGDGKPAVEARLNSPASVTMDAAGNLYIADSGNHRVRKVDPTGLITTIVGTGAAGKEGDGGPASLAQLYRPRDAFVDRDGNVYVADVQAAQVRKVDTAGVITTVAVTGLGAPSSVYLDSAGNLYITDTLYHHIRKVEFDPAGNVTTTTTIQASLNLPRGIFVDPTGNIYIADSGNHRVQKVDAGGIVFTVAGNGTSGAAGDGGKAILAQLSHPRDVFVDLAGNLYIADSGNHRVRKVDLAGDITTIAGTGTPEFSGEGGPATLAELNDPTAVFLDHAGMLYIADYGNHRIRKVEAATSIITTVAGASELGLGDGGPAVRARLTSPDGIPLGDPANGVFVDRTRNVFIADTYNQRIRKVDPSGVISTVAGSGPSGIQNGGFSGDSGPATQARLNDPIGICVDPAGNCYFADTYNMRIRKVDASTGFITTVAGGGNAGLGDGGQATQAQLNVPRGVAVDPAGNIYIADTGNFRVRRVDAATGIISTVAGGGTAGLGDGGDATKAQLNQPAGISLDSNGNLLIADTRNHRIRKVDAATRIITTVAGTGAAGYDSTQDSGPATQAKLDTPHGVTVDAGNNIFIADTGSRRIRKVDASGIITTILGAGATGLSGEDVPTGQATVNEVSSVFVDAAGNIWWTESDTGLVRRFHPGR